MSGNWLNNSEVAAGLVFAKKKLSAHDVDAAQFAPPYDKLIRRLKDGDTLSDLMTENFGAMNSAIQASETVPAEVQASDIIKALSKSKAANDAAVLFSTASRKLERGEDVDVSAILATVQEMENGEDIFRKLSEVKPETNIFVPTHYPPIDKHVGGIPYACLTIIGAPPGVGKTSLLGKIAIASAAKEKKKSVLLFSLEMTMGQILNRFMEIGISKLKVADRKEVMGRIIITDHALTISEIDAEASRKCRSQDISMIGIDFADMTVRGENSAAAMEEVYRTCALLAKRTGVPVVLLAQLNDKYVGGMPQVNHLRWSRMAEAYAALIFMIYNPGQLWVDQGESKNKTLPHVHGMGYLIIGKSRFGTAAGGIGAIMCEWDGKTSWGDAPGKWFPLKQA